MKRLAAWQVADEPSVFIRLPRLCEQAVRTAVTGRCADQPGIHETRTGLDRAGPHGGGADPPSADEYERLKRRGRWALAVGGLPVAEFDAVRRVEPLAEVAGYDHNPKCPDQRFPSLMGSRT